MELRDALDRERRPARAYGGLALDLVRVEVEHNAVRAGDRDVTLLEPGERNIAQVFQFPVIYDTMTVFDNLAFPLRNQGMAEARIHTKVQEIAEVLDLQSLLDKKARNLTADQKKCLATAKDLTGIAACTPSAIASISPKGRVAEAVDIIGLCPRFFLDCRPIPDP